MSDAHAERGGFGGRRAPDGMDIEVVREVSPELLAELKELFDRAREHDHHQPLGEHKWLDLTHDGRDGFVAFVAREGGTLVGYAHLSRHGHGWGLEIVVHPDHRDGEIEHSLVEEAVKVAREQGHGHLHLWVFQPTETHDRLATDLGLQKGRELLHMEVPLPVAKEPAFPPGVRVRAFEPGRDEQAWLEVNNRAFKDHFEQGSWDMATLRRRMEEPWFDPEGLLLAVDDAGIAGFCWTKVDPATGCGEIYVIGVDPSRQSAGLGKPLVLAGLQHLASKGVQKGCLYVDSAQEKALNMYRAIGFEVDHVDRAYAIDL
jgi:mycothiol synthase